MNFLAIIGFLALLGGVSYLLISMEEKRDKEAQEYLKLLDTNFSLKEEFQRYRSRHRDWTVNKCARKFFDEPGRLEQAYKEKEEQERILRKIEDERNKEYIVKRVYAYKYEDFLFSLYSPLAWFSKGSNEWLPPIAGRLPKEYVKYRMKEAGLEIVEDLYNEFIQNDLLKMEYRHQGTSNQIELGCELGYTLTNYANVISEDDNNIDKWIKKHGQSMNEEKLLKDIDTYNLPF